VRLALYRDRNYLSSNVLLFVLGMTLFATLALLPPLMQVLMGYSVFQSGLVTSPRGIGGFVAMLVMGRIVGRFDARLVIGVGLALTALSLWQMTRFSLQMDMGPFLWSGITQGIGTSLVFVPLATLAFATLAPALRNEGAALFALVRNLGSSIGISVVQGLFVRNAQVVHASLAAHVTPFALATHALGPFSGAASTAALNRAVSAQASMIAYLDDFHLMLVLVLMSLPLLLLVRGTVRQASEPAHVAID
jgi:DHA2 family multidrug resistance protein